MLKIWFNSVMTAKNGVVINLLILVFRRKYLSSTKISPSRTIYSNMPTCIRFLIVGQNYGNYAHLTLISPNWSLKSIVKSHWSFLFKPFDKEGL